MKTFFRVLFLLGLFLFPWNRTFAIQHQNIPVSVNIDTNLFVEDSFHHQILELSPYYINAEQNTLSLQTEDSFWLTTYVSGDIFYAYSDFEATNGIKSIEYSIERVKNCSLTEEIMVPTTKLPNNRLNKISFTLTPGLYKIIITINTIAENYQNLFVECSNSSKTLSYFFSVEQENITWIPHKSIRIFPTSVETQDNSTIIAFKHSLETLSESVAGLLYYWDNLSDETTFLSPSIKEITPPKEFVSGSTHTLHYAILYTDNCTSKFQTYSITIK